MGEVRSSDCVFQVGVKSDLLLDLPTVLSYPVSKSCQSFSGCHRPCMHRIQDAVKCQTVLDGFLFFFLPSVSLVVENCQMKTCPSSLLPVLVSFSKVKDMLTKIYYTHKNYVDEEVKVN